MDIDDDEEARTQDLQVTKKKQPPSRSASELLVCEELDDAIIGPNQSLELGAGDRRWHHKGARRRFRNRRFWQIPEKLCELRLQS